MHAWVLFEHSSFVPQTINMLIRLNSDSKMPLGMSVRVKS